MRGYFSDDAWARWGERYFDDWPSSAWRALFRDIGSALGEPPEGDRAQALLAQAITWWNADIGSDANLARAFATATAKRGMGAVAGPASCNGVTRNSRSRRSPDFSAPRHGPRGASRPGGHLHDRSPIDRLERLTARRGAGADRRYAHTRVSRPMRAASCRAHRPGDSAARLATTEATMSGRLLRAQRQRRGVELPLSRRYGRPCVEQVRRARGAVTHRAPAVVTTAERVEQRRAVVVGVVGVKSTAFQQLLKHVGLLKFATVRQPFGVGGTRMPASERRPSNSRFCRVTTAV